MSKILIIEDEAAIRRVLVKILSEENDAYKVSEAEDGLAGAELIKKEDFDLWDKDKGIPSCQGVDPIKWLLDSAYRHFSVSLHFLSLHKSGDYFWFAPVEQTQIKIVHNAKSNLSSIVLAFSQFGEDKRNASFVKQYLSLFLKLDSNSW